MKRIRGTLHRKITTNAQIFEERGDYWGGKRQIPYPPGEVSILQRQADAIRFEGTGRDGSFPAEEAERRRQEFPENPDLDRWTKAGFAKPKPRYVDPVPTSAPSGKLEELQRQAYSIKHSMHMAMAANKLVKVKPSTEIIPQRPDKLPHDPRPRYSSFSFVADNAKWEGRGGRNRKKAPK